jgi:hypothetical protein
MTFLMGQGGGIHMIANSDWAPRLARAPSRRPRCLPRGGVQWQAHSGSPRRAQALSAGKRLQRCKLSPGSEGAVLGGGYEAIMWAQYTGSRYEASASGGPGLNTLRLLVTECYGATERGRS